MDAKFETDGKANVRDNALDWLGMHFFKASKHRAGTGAPGYDRVVVAVNPENLRWGQQIRVHKKAAWKRKQRVSTGPNQP